MSKRILSILLPLLVITMAGGCAGQSGDVNARLTQLENQTRVLSNQMNALQPADTLSSMQQMKNDLSVLQNRFNELSGANPNQEIAQLRAEVDRLQAAVRMAHSQLGIDLAPLDKPLEITPLRTQTPPTAASATSAAALAPGASAATPGTSASTPDELKSGDTVTVLVNGVPHEMKVEAPTLTPGAAGTPQTTAEETGAATSATAGSSTPPVPGMPAASDKKPENVLYDSASKAFSERRYKDALDSWKQFTDLYPNHSLTPNAYFWQGESSYQLQDYARAAVAYQQVIEKFPRSNKYAQALLKQGLSFLKTGKTEAGQVRLNEVIKKFPKSTEAARAKKILAQK